MQNSPEVQIFCCPPMQRTCSLLRMCPPPSGLEACETFQFYMKANIMSTCKDGAITGLMSNVAFLTLFQFIPFDMHHNSEEKLWLAHLALTYEERKSACVPNFETRSLQKETKVNSMTSRIKRKGLRVVQCLRVHKARMLVPY